MRKTVLEDKEITSDHSRGRGLVLNMSSEKAESW